MTTDDERRLQALHQRVLDGWNAGSGERFAAPFGEDALFIGFDGSVLHGRQAIADSHQELFDRWLKGSRLVGERTEIRFASADVAIVHAVGATIARGRSRPSPERDSIQTLVAVRGAAGWSFACFQNTRIRPIGAGALSALLWLLADKLWKVLFRMTRTAPRETALKRNT